MPGPGGYSLKIELIGQSTIFQKNWKIRVWEDGYTGDVIYRNVPAASPFLPKKDSAETVRGTSLQFSIRAIADFEFIDLFTCDTKKYMVELLDSTDTVVWVGYLLPEQYQETYKPAPNVVTFTASDQLGLLKEAKYTSTKTRKSFLTIISECLANTGLSIGYSISLGISEYRQTANRSVLKEVYVDASIYNQKSCYEVLESIIGQFDATITQDGVRWLITDSYKTAPRINYSDACVFESVGSAFDTSVLGQLGNSGTELYPTGSPLDFTLATSYKILKLTQEYGLKTDMLPPSTQDAWTNPYTLPGWTTFGTVQFSGMVINTEFLISLTGNTCAGNIYNSGVLARLPEVETATEDFCLSFDFSSIRDTGGANYNVNFRVRIIVFNGPNTYYLTKTGWLLNPASINDQDGIRVDNVADGTYQKPSFSTFKVTFTGIPLDGTMFVEITLPAVYGKGIDPVGLPVGLILKNFSLMQLVAGAAQSAGQIRTITLNESTSAQTKDIQMFAGDVPEVPNRTLLFRNYTTFSDGTLTGQWLTPDIATTSLLDVLTAIYASNNRRAKQLLKGRIRGEFVAFDKVVQINYPATRIFEFLEFSNDLIADAVDVTLSEILPYQDVSYTTTSEAAESSSPSSSNGNLQETTEKIASKQYFHGFEDADSSALSFNNSTKVFSITGTDFIVWNHGTRLTMNTDSVGSVGDGGLPFTWYYYYNTNDTSVILSSDTIWDRETDIPVAIVEWDGTAGVVKDMRYSCFNINHILADRFEDLAHPDEDIFVGVENFDGTGIMTDQETNLKKALEKIDKHKHYRLYQPDLTNPFVYTQVDDGVPTLHVEGDIVQTGETFEAHFEKLFTKKDMITLRDGATAGLADGAFTGLRAKLYDGVHDGSLVFDNLGIARVGDNGSEQAIATRIETPTNDYLAKWNAANLRLDFISQDTFAPKIHNFIDTTNHPVTGLTAGHFLKALTGTTYGFAAHGLTYSDVGAQATHANLTSLSALTYVSGSFVKMTGAGTFALDTTAYLATSLKGSVNGLAELDANGFVKNTQLPSYVDDVLEGTLISNSVFNDLASNPYTPESGKIYVDTTTNKTYRWSGSLYAIISDTLALGETSATAYRGDRGKSAYDHTFLTNNPHAVTAAQLGLVIGTDVLACRTFGSAANSAITDFAPASTVSFPGFGITHALAAYGDHAHAGVYDPAGTTATHAALTTTAHGLGASAFHADSYFQMALDNSYGAPTFSGISSNGDKLVLANTGSAEYRIGLGSGGEIWYQSSYRHRFLTGANSSSIGVEALNLAADGAATFGSTVSATQFSATSDIITPTVNLTTGAAVNYTWQCTNAATGAGHWANITNTQTFISTWDASANLPVLADGTGTNGYYHTVQIAGDQDLGSGSIHFEENSTVIYNGLIWQKLPAPSITGAALTKTDDTNITLTLGGSPSSSLVNATSITVGWTGTLADSRIASGSKWNGAVYADQTSGQTVGSTAARLTKLWATDITVSNAIIGSVTGNAGSATVLFNNGNYIGGDGLYPLAWWDNEANTSGVRNMYQTNTLYYQPASGILHATSFTGAGTGLTGTAAALNIGGNAATATTASATTAAVTFAATGGAATGTSFNGSTARTIDYSTVGAQVAGSYATALDNSYGAPTFSGISSNGDKLVLANTGSVEYRIGLGSGGEIWYQSSYRHRFLTGANSSSIGVEALNLAADGAATFASTVNATQFQSNTTTGTAPLTVASTTLVSNLNADLLDGQHGSYYQAALGFTPYNATNPAGYITSSALSGYWYAGTGNHPTTIAGYGITDAPAAFPGFGTSHGLAAYGDHAHAGVYDPAGTTATHAALTTTAHGLGASAFHVDGYYQVAGSYWYSASHPTTIAGYGITDAPAAFPGFGTTHSVAAYGDHAHAGVYDPAGTTATHAALTTTAHGLGASAFHVDGYYQVAGSYWYSASHPTTISGYGITDAPAAFPGFGTTHSLAAYGDHTHSGYGSGDVVGPASATSSCVALFDGTTGKLLKNSSLFYDNNYSEISAGALYLNGSGAHGSTLTVVGGGAFSSSLSASNFMLSSDRRRKTGIDDYKPEFLNVTYRNFFMKDDLTRRRSGVIHDELKLIAPELTYTDIQGFGQVAYIDLLVRETAWLKYKISPLDELVQKVADLEQEVRQLKTELKRA